MIKSKSLLSLPVWIIPTLIAASVFLALTRLGIGLSPDSIAYYGVAENLKNGLGVTVPYGLPPNQALTQFPPLLPLLTAMISALGFPTITAARVINLALLIAFMLLSSIILRKLGVQSRLLHLAYLILISAFALVHPLFNMLWAEPLMLVAGYAGFTTLFFWQERRSPWILLAAGVFFALSVMARYAGITFLASALLFILLFIRDEWVGKLRQSLLLSAPAIVFVAYWAIRDTGESGSATNRILGFHPITVAHIRQAADTISQWFLIPLSAPGLIKLAAALALTAFLLFLFRQVFIRLRTSGNLFFERLLLLFIAVYVVFLVFSASFLDANIPFDHRLLSPLLYAVLLLLPTALRFAFPSSQKPGVPAFTASALALLFAGIMIFQSRSALTQAYTNGIGFNSLAWRQYAVFDYLNTLPQPHFLVSNAPEPAYFYTHQAVAGLPRPFLVMQQQANPNYEKEIKLLTTANTDLLTYFIFFHSIRGGSAEEIASLQSQLDLSLLTTFPEASIYTFETRK